MRKFHFSFVLLLFLLVPASIIWGQKISSEKGITTAVFTLEHGVATLYLPSDIRSGDVISGTVIASPAGKNEKLQKTNLEKMMGSTLTLFSTDVKLEKAVQSFRLNIPNQLSEVISWKQTSGPVLTATIPSSVFAKKMPVTDRCVFPSHVLTGSPFNVHGVFDGDLMNTSASIGGSSAKIMAESPRQCIALWPLTATGQKQTSITENGNTCTEPVSGVDMIITTGKLNLRKGENTYIDVKLTGLQSLPDKAVLTITNLSEQIVTMTNGNKQVIPIWPLGDSAEGTISFHFPAMSINVGNFDVNINLELPDNIRIHSTAGEEVPVGYIRKTCECSVNPTITKTGNTFSVQANGACGGAHGIGIETFERCKTAYIGYDWQVTSGKENADINGPGKTSTFTVKPKNNGQFIICVVVTVVCIDGTTCSNTVCINQEGITLAPGTTVRPDPTLGDPTTDRPPPSKCNCSCTVAITALGAAGKDYNYSAAAIAQCTGSSGTGTTRVRCSVTSVSYEWAILGAAPTTRLKGAANQPAVTIERDATDPFNLQVTATVICSDGTTCQCIAIIEVGGESPKCSPVVMELMEPAMDGGFVKAYRGLEDSRLMLRDEFIVLQAYGTDWDKIEFQCNPNTPHCTDDSSMKRFGVEGRVAYQWATAEGGFVSLGCLPGDKTATGERVIFKPPAIPLPVAHEDTTVTFEITLQILDDGSPAVDATVTRPITVEIKRTIKKPDYYDIQFTGDPGRPPARPNPEDKVGTCFTEAPQWKPGNDLTPPVIVSPNVPDNDKMVFGQWLLLSAADQPDMDIISFRCSSKAKCETGTEEKTYSEPVNWNWKILRGGGKFITGDVGRTVIYQPPLEATAEETEVIIELTVSNSSFGNPRVAGASRMDAPKTSSRAVIKFYKPGIQLEHPPLSWLPEDTNSVEINSKLMYRRGAQWRDGLAHMCRIHFFEMTNVSTQIGICMNDPANNPSKERRKELGDQLPKPDNCLDLYLKTEGAHETLPPDDRNSCDTLFQLANTVGPELNYRIRVRSRDFGSFGALSSYANIDKGVRVKPLYVSIPVKLTDVRHPDGRPKKTVYKDNRVSIPHDIDENHIADGGWLSWGGRRIADPLNNKLDIENLPVGDGFTGDGLVNYEEYRGFRVLNANGLDTHHRCSPIQKDIFIFNRDHLPLGLYERISGLIVHEISEVQFNNQDDRHINFNFDANMHDDLQRGLCLLEFERASQVTQFANTELEGLLGVAVSKSGQPSRPYEQLGELLFTERIAEVCNQRNIDVATKIEAVTAHELLHGNNVCHHGEGDYRIEGSSDIIHGLRSGNMSCVMRYDNKGRPIKDYRVEPIGSTLCDSPKGTGYNAANNNFGDAATGRGNCQGQIRISGKGPAPRSCGPLPIRR